MPKSRKTLFIVTVFAAIGIAVVLFAYPGFRRNETTHASSVPDLFSALPVGAPTLIYVDLAAIRASPFYQHRADKGPIAVPDRDYAEFMQSTGFNFEKDLDRVVVGSWPSSAGPASLSKEVRNIIVIADGRFDRAKIRNYAKQKGKVDTQKGREVFLFPTAAQAGWSSLTFLDDHRIAIVEGSSIAPLFEGFGSSLTAKSTDKITDNPSSGSAIEPSEDPTRQRAARMNGAAAFIIARMPPVPENFSPGGVQSAQLANLARSLQWLSFGATPDGDNLRVSLEGECATSANAHQLQAALEVLRLFGRAALESPKTKQSMDPATFTILESLLKTAEVTTTAERVRILVEITPDVLKLSGPQKTL